MNINDELAEARAQLSAHQAKNPEQHSASSMNQAASNESFLQSRALTDQAVENSKQAVYRASGILEMRGTYHNDTMINVGGIEARLDSAIAAGLVPKDTLGKAIGSEESDPSPAPKDDEKPEPKDDTSPLDLDDINNSITPEMNGQLQYVDTVLGPELSQSLLSSALSGGLNVDHEAVANLADASGLSMADALSSVEDVMDAKIAPVAQAFQQLVGQNVDFDHALQWIQSNAVSHQDKQALNTALSSGNGYVLMTLAEKYRAYNAQASK